MTATPLRSSAAADLGAPDPANFVATRTPVGATAVSQASVDAAADTGMVVSGRERLLAGFGVAATLPLPRGLEDDDALLAVRAWLAAVECAARPGVDGEGSLAAPPGVLALGAFPFDRGAPTSLVVPSVTLCRDADGRTWRVDVRRRGDPGEDAGPAPRRVDRSPGPADPGHGGRPAIAQIPPPAGYAGAVAHAVSGIRAGQLRKVVLGRMVEVTLPAPAAPAAVLRALRGTEGIFSPFSVPIPGGRLVGASPELVIARRGTTVTSHALAGTVPLSDTGGDADAERLLDSAKDRAEHRWVVEEIVAALEPRCASLTVPAMPTVVRLRSDARLGTLISGTLLGTPAPAGTALALLALLHPTPAVGGVPRDIALDRIAELEPAPRGYWAGVVGWTDSAGDGEWVLGIRSIELDGLRARVRAGAGIVEDSDPEQELDETTVKLRPALDALWPGTSSLL